MTTAILLVGSIIACIAVGIGSKLEKNERNSVTKSSIGRSQNIGKGLIIYEKL